MSSEETGSSSQDTQNSWPSRQAEASASLRA
jgi:hypothetical protein